jgi:hypothetical protein
MNMPVAASSASHRTPALSSSNDGSPADLARDFSAE